MIELKNVTKIYNTSGNSAIGLNDITLTLPDTGFVCIVGPSGSGKTTLLNVVSCIDSYEEGEMIIDGISTSSLSSDELEKYRRNNVGFVYQNYNLIDSHTVLQNVLLPLEINGVPHKEAKEKALELITKVGLKDRAHNRATKLSGGEKQRCVIARALASGAKIISCDEPTGNLDSNTSAEIISLLQELSKDHLVLMVTHNLESVNEYATRIIKIFDGQIAGDKIISTSENVSVESKHVDNVPFKVLFKTASRNVFSTPKRTILTSIIMIVLFVVISIAFSVLVTGRKEILYESYYSGGYNVNYKARNIITNAKNSIDEIDTDGKIVYNDFYYDRIYMCTISTVPSDIIQFSMGYGKGPKDVYGVTLDKCKKGEVILLLNDMEYKDRQVKKMIGGEIEVKNYGNYKIAGTKLTSGDSQIFLPENMKEEFSENYLKFNFGQVLEKINLSSKIGANFGMIIYSGDEYDISIPTYIKDISNHIYIGDQLLDLSLLNVDYNEPKITQKDPMGYTNFWYEGGNDYVGTPYITISYSGFKKIIDKYTVRASIFYESVEQSEKEYELFKDTYDVLNMNYFRSDRITIDTVLDYVLLCFVLGGIVMLVFLVTYLILSLVLKSKNKDYNIFRTIGLLKKDLKKVSILELELKTCLSLIIVFIILGFMTKIKGLGFYLVEMLSTIYIPFVIALVSLGMVYLLAIRYNRKIFKLTIGQSLKAGDFID